MKAFLALLVFLVGCDVRQNEELLQTRDDKTFTMTVELVSPEQIRSKCDALGVQYEANGCTAFNLDTKHCTIYVMPQRYAHDDERLTVIGHETWHCRFGKWHN